MLRERKPLGALSGYNRKDMNIRKTQIQGKRMSNGLIALLLVASFDLLGAIYFRYLETNPFPPDIVRLIPALWLIGTLLSGVLAARALRSDANRVPAGLALVLDVPSAVIALVFVFAALMGD
jgi:phage shock protein PspC (stress-responsive transcriptional regulator)